MRATIKKMFLAWDFDKEEAWLNEMAAKGLSLVAVGLCRYDFEETEPGAYQVAMEMLPHAVTHPESVQYLRFLEETGAEYVGNVMRWIYVRKPAAEGEFRLHSDISSRVQFLIRIMWLLGVIAATNLYIGILNLSLWLRMHNPLSLCCLLSFALVLWVTYGIVRLGIKAVRIAKEKQIYED